MKSLAVEILVQPQDHTLAEAEIEQLSAKVVAAAANPEPRTSSAPVQRRAITAIIRPEYCRHRI